MVNLVYTAILTISEKQKGFDFFYLLKVSKNSVKCPYLTPSPFLDESLFEAVFCFFFSFLGTGALWDD